MDNIKEYEIFIENLAKSGEDKIFLNSSAEHAAIVMKTIFKYAKDRIQLYANDLNGDVSKDKDYQLEVKKFLERGGKLHVLVEDANTCKQGEMYQIINHYSFFHPDKIQIRKSNVKVVYRDQNIEGSTSPVHFAVADKTMYRIEIDTNKYLAKGSFKDVNFSSSLSQTFNSIYNSDTQSVALDKC